MGIRTSPTRTGEWRAVRLGVALAVVVAGLVIATAPPAAAGLILVTPSISGSGLVTGVTGCTSPPSVPSGTITQCSQGIGGNPGGPGQASLTAVPQATPSGHWVFTGWQTGTCPIPSGNTCFMQDNSAGGVSSFAPRAVFVDSTGPALTPTVTKSTTVDRSVTVSWSTNEPLGSAVCSFDGAPFAACSSTSSHTATLSEGSHSFAVKGTDLSGNEGSPSSPPSFRVLDTTLVSGPADVSNLVAPTFTFSSLTGTTFDCALDGGTFSSCATKDGSGRGTTTLAALADGAHTFRVRARDGADVDTVPLARTWTVDTVAPTVTLDPNRGPNEGALQAATTETFAFSASEAATFSCRLDAAAFAPCGRETTLTGLRPGPHRFEVRATDAAGNTGAAVARSWTVAGSPVDPAAKIKAAVGDETTKVTKLEVTGLAAGIEVRLTCKGVSCPGRLTGKGVTKTADGPTLSLTKLVKRAALEPGTKLRIRVDDTGVVTEFTVKVRAGKKPSIKEA